MSGLKHFYGQSHLRHPTLNQKTRISDSDRYKQARWRRSAFLALVCGSSSVGGVSFLVVGAFAPAAPEVYNFEVSGLKVVQSWLSYRMRDPKGKKSSPLDGIRREKWAGDFPTELLELQWILEAAIAECPRQAKLLTAVAKGPKIRL